MKGLKDVELLSGKNELAFAPHFQDLDYQVISIGRVAHWMPQTASEPAHGLLVVTGHAPGLDFAQVLAGVHGVNHPHPQLDNPVVFEVHNFVLVPSVELPDTTPDGFVLVGFQFDNPNQIQIQCFRKTLGQPFAPSQFVSPAQPGWCSEIGIYVRMGT